MIFYSYIDMFAISVVKATLNPVICGPTKGSTWV